jgi:protein required for attachment to host cells
MTSTRQWFVTADGRRATLYWCEPTPGGRLHVEAKQSLENEEAEKRERQRPSILARGPSGSARPASFGHDVEEDARRFAKKVSEWVGNEARESKMDRVVMFAAPRFLGHLRSDVGGGLNGKAKLVEAELTKLRAHELADHPAVKAAVTAALPGAGAADVGLPGRPG